MDNFVENAEDGLNIDKISLHEEEGEILSDPDFEPEEVSESAIIIIEKETNKLVEQDLEEGELSDENNTGDYNSYKFKEGGFGGSHKFGAKNDMSSTIGPTSKIPCRFFIRGINCNWGLTCRFLHPGVNDGHLKYIPPLMGTTPQIQMPSPTMSILSSELKNRSNDTSTIDGENLPRDKIGTKTGPETAWERGLKQAKRLSLIKRNKSDLGEHKELSDSADTNIKREDGDSELERESIKNKDNLSVTVMINDPAKKPHSSNSSTTGSSDSSSSSEGGPDGKPQNVAGDLTSEDQNITSNVEGRKDLNDTPSASSTTATTPSAVLKSAKYPPPLLRDLSSMGSPALYRGPPPALYPPPRLFRPPGLYYPRPPLGFGLRPLPPPGLYFARRPPPPHMLYDYHMYGGPDQGSEGDEDLENPEEFRHRPYDRPYAGGANKSLEQDSPPSNLPYRYREQDYEQRYYDNYDRTDDLRDTLTQRRLKRYRSVSPGRQGLNKDPYDRRAPFNDRSGRFGGGQRPEIERPSSSERIKYAKQLTMAERKKLREKELADEEDAKRRLNLGEGKGVSHASSGDESSNLSLKRQRSRRYYGYFAGECTTKTTDDRRYSKDRENTNDYSGKGDKRARLEYSKDGNSSYRTTPTTSEIQQSRSTGRAYNDKSAYETYSRRKDSYPTADTNERNVPQGRRQRRSSARSTGASARPRFESGPLARRPQDDWHDPWVRRQRTTQDASPSLGARKAPQHSTREKIVDSDDHSTISSVESLTAPKQHTKHGTNISKEHLAKKPLTKDSTNNVKHNASNHSSDEESSSSSSSSQASRPSHTDAAHKRNANRSASYTSVSSVSSASDSIGPDNKTNSKNFKPAAALISTKKSDRGVEKHQPLKKSPVRHLVKSKEHHILPTALSTQIITETDNFSNYDNENDPNNSIIEATFSPVTNSESSRTTPSNKSKSRNHKNNNERTQNNKIGVGGVSPTFSKSSSNHHSSSSALGSESGNSVKSPARNRQRETPTTDSHGHRGVPLTTTKTSNLDYHAKAKTASITSKSSEHSKHSSNLKKLHGKPTAPMPQSQRIQSEYTINNHREGDSLTLKAPNKPADLDRSIKSARDHTQKGAVARHPPITAIVNRNNPNNNLLTSSVLRKTTATRSSVIIGPKDVNLPNSASYSANPSSTGESRESKNKRREELLKQLRAVEEAIARKRTK